jgi:dinuclear metal center YbgI/SA1388 family protein
MPVSVSVKEVCACIEEFAPLALQEAWDNCGLLVGASEQAVDKALLTIDVTEAVVAEAIDLKAQMIISHHPVILSGVKQLTGANDAQRAVMLAVKHDIALYAAHTNMDLVQGGVSYRMAQKLGLRAVQALAPRTGLGQQLATGLGVVGILPAPVGEQNFLQALKDIFHAPAIRHTRLRGKEISKVALCGGSGSSLLEDAVRSQADVFVTADFKYHQFADADNHLLVADLGHFESEQFTKEIFHEILIKKFPTFAAHFSQVKTNPINYL